MNWASPLFSPAAATALAPLESPGGASKRVQPPACVQVWWCRVPPAIEAIWSRPVPSKVAATAVALVNF